MKEKTLSIQSGAKYRVKTEGDDFLPYFHINIGPQKLTV